MVQILPPRESFGEIIGRGLGGGFSQGLQQFMDSSAKRKQLEQQFAQQLGLQREKIASQEKQRMEQLSQQKEILAEKLANQLALEKEKFGFKEKLQGQKLSAHSKSEEENYNKIKDAFGEQFADVWKASPVGARTALESAAVQQGLRQLPIGGLFGEEAEELGEPIERQSTGKIKQQDAVKTPSGEEFTFPKISPPQETTPSERVKYKSTLRKENAPLFAENKGKLKGLKGEKDRLSILSNLSDKVPDGLGRLFINKEGGIRPFAQVLQLVPPEAERFVKTVNDFITTAKDIFGSRVTNYDLQVFKSRLPSLINSAEGRRQIIRQMNIFNELESDYHDSLNKVYKHYGLGNISQEEAERLAEEMVATKEKQLREEFSSISSGFDLPEMPNPDENVGKIIEDEEGNRFRSNGIEWEPI